MVQFVCGADLVQWKEVVSAVRYPVLLIPTSTRSSTLTFVSIISLDVLLLSIHLTPVDFGFRYDIDPVTFSPSTDSTATTAGQRDYSLTCSSTLFDPSRLPSGAPSPNFQWSFNGSTSLPSDVTAMPTTNSRNSTSETYSSTLQFGSQLSQSLHTGMYTCRLGAGSLAAHKRLTVNSMLYA